MKKYLWHLLHFIGIGVFIYILSGVDWDIFLHEMKELSVYRFLTLAVLILLTDLLRGERFRIILELEEKHTTFRKAFLIYMSGEFWGNISPGRSAELYKMRYVKLSNLKRLMVVLTDRGFDFLCMVFLALIAYGLFMRSATVIWSTVIAYICIIIVFFLIRENSDKKTIDSIIKKMGLENILTRWDWWQITRIVFHSMVSEFYFAFWNYLLIVYFLGIDMSIFQVFIMVAIVTAGSALPISFLGLGTREAVALYFFAQAGYDNSHAVLYGTFSLVFFMIFANAFSILCWRYIESKNIRI